MTYRVGKEEHWPAIVQFLLDTKYYAPINPATLGGHWFIAEKDGKVYSSGICKRALG